MKLIKSRTFWTIVIMFLVGGIQSIHAVFPGDWATVAEGFLGMLATFYHLNPSQNYTNS